MGKWTREKVNSENLNGGNQYEAKDRLSREQLNAMVNAGLYAQDFAEHLADTPDVSQANNVGTPSVEFIDNGKYKKLKFSNLKGDKGDKGEKGDKGDAFSGGTVGSLTFDSGGKGLTFTTKDNVQHFIYGDGSSYSLWDRVKNSDGTYQYYKIIDENGKLYSGKEEVSVKTDFRTYQSLIPEGNAIPANADLNSPEYLKVGNHYCQYSSDAKTLLNSPTQNAFLMTVYSPLSKTFDNETSAEWVYRVRKILTFKGEEYVQYAYTEGTIGVYSYTKWEKVIKQKTLNNSQTFTFSNSNRVDIPLGVNCSSSIKIKFDINFEIGNYGQGFEEFTESLISYELFVKNNTSCEDNCITYFRKFENDDGSTIKEVCFANFITSCANDTLSVWGLNIYSNGSNGVDQSRIAKISNIRQVID